MNHPIHSVQYVRKKYKTYQFISVLFALITIVAAISATITGFRITQLIDHQKETISLQKTKTADLNELQAEIKALKKESIGYQKELASEKKRVKSLSAKIETLKNELKKISDLPVAKSTPRSGSIAGDAAGPERSASTDADPESIPSASPMTTVKPPSATASDPGTMDDTPPPATATQPAVAPATDP